MFCLICKISKKLDFMSYLLLISQQVLNENNSICCPPFPVKRMLCNCNVSIISNYLLLYHFYFYVCIIYSSCFWPVVLYILVEFSFNLYLGLFGTKKEVYVCCFIEIAWHSLPFACRRLNINFSQPLQIGWIRVSYAILEGLQFQIKSHIIVFTSLNTMSGVWITLAIYSNGDKARLWTTVSFPFSDHFLHFHVFNIFLKFNILFL